MKSTIIILSAYLLADGADSPIGWRALAVIAAVIIARLVLLSMRTKPNRKI